MPGHVVSCGRHESWTSPLSVRPVPARLRSGIGSVSGLLTGAFVGSTVGGVGIAVLGALQVDGQANGLSPRDRVVLSALVVRAGAPISTDALADALWGRTCHPRGRR